MKTNRIKSLREDLTAVVEAARIMGEDAGEMEQEGQTDVAADMREAEARLESIIDFVEEALDKAEREKAAAAKGDPEHAIIRAGNIFWLEGGDDLMYAPLLASGLPDYAATGKVSPDPYEDPRAISRMVATLKELASIN